jgi:ribonuclease G
LGGIISIDFVDSKNADIKEQIFEEMQKAMKPDRANHTILPLSKFCVMQITRSRVKPQVVVKNQEHCPSCNGTGKISSSILITNSIHQKFKALSKDYNSLIIEVHPFIYAFLKIGIISTIFKWQWKYKCSVRLIQNSDLAINEYHFYDKNRVLL